MRMLFADTLPRHHLDRLTDAGHVCVVEEGLTADSLPDRIAGFDALVVRSTRVTAATLDRADELGLIVRAGAGTDTIDIQGAADRGIYVCNVPGTNAVAVAELAMGLLLAVDRHIADGTADLRQGVWNKSRYQQARGLYGRTVAIIGLGEIGLAFAARARAFGLEPTAERKAGRSAEVEQRIRSIGVRLVEDRADLLDRADVVSIHVPGSAATAGMVDDGFLARMRPGAVLLNTSRGDVIDEAALIRAMDERGIRAGLDVFRNEPGTGSGSFTSALAQHPNVVGTHHIGASTEQAQDATAAGVVHVLEAYATGTAVNCVNLIRERHGEHSITIRHYDRVGVLASVLDVLRQAELNVNTMQNRIFVGSRAAVATIDVSGELDDETIEELLAAPDVIQVVVTATAP